MAKNLNWFQARTLARNGSNIRRDAWRRWLKFSRSTYLWFIYTPPSADVAEETHVVLNKDFTDFEFLANDWTDEGWDQPPDKCPVGYHWDEFAGACVPDNDGGHHCQAGYHWDGTACVPNDSDHRCPAGYHWDGSSCVADGGSGSGGGGNGGGGGGSGGGGGGWGGGGNGGGGNGGGGGWGGGGGGSGGGGSHNKPPKPPAEPADYTPKVEVALDPGDLDGPGCFIQVPQNGKANVNVTLPNPANGKVKVALISVTCFGQTRLGTLGPGAAQGFQFEGPINPGGEVTATATASDGNGHTWTGSGKDKWPKVCLLPTLTWGGSQNITQRCKGPGSTGDTGYDQDDNYSTTAQYAVNPDTGGTGSDTGVQFGDANNAHTTVTPYPGGSPSTTDWHVSPPGSITCEVDGHGGIKNIQPKKLGILYDGSKTEKSGECTTTTSGSESGP